MMKVPLSTFDTAWSMLRSFIAKQGRNVAEANHITHKEGIAIVKRRIKIAGVGSGGTIVTVELYHISTAKDDLGEQYDQYIGNDGNYYTEIVSSGNVYKS